MKPTEFLRRRTSLSAGVFLALSASLIPSPGFAAPQTLRGHAAMVSGLQPAGFLQATQRLDLAFALPLRDADALDRLLADIYNPASPNFRHYLTSQQFADRFGPSERDYQAMIAFARAHGLTVTQTHPNRTLLNVSGTVADVEKTFQVRMRTYPHPQENRRFYAADADPSFDPPVPVLAVDGLDNFGRARPAGAIPKPANLASPNLGSGPSGSFWGYDFRVAYVQTFPPNSEPTGAGQSVGLVQFDGYDISDIESYVTDAGLDFPNGLPLQNVLVDGYDGHVDLDNVEVCLDIEMVLAMAPGISNVYVYEAPNGGLVNINDLLNRMATDNVAKQLSCSWTWNPGNTNGTTHQIFLQMAAQGQAFFQASGDDDAYHNDYDFFIPPNFHLRYSCNPIITSQPVEDPYVIDVGGTTLTMSGTGQGWQSETVWNWGYVPAAADTRPFGIGSGGGFGTNFAIPTWQQGICMSANQGSYATRNVPDVAMAADNIWVKYTYVNPFNPANRFHTEGAFGGTSCAAPLWAGYSALLNEYAVLFGRPVLGYLNPVLYAVGKGPNYANDFNDITSGNNTNTCDTVTNTPWGGQFHAAPGYDLCTGWGSPKNFFSLYPDLFSPPTWPTPVVSVSLDGPPDIYKGYTGPGFPVGGYTWFTLSRTGPTGSPLSVTFFLGADGAADSTPYFNYNPCYAYHTLDFTPTNCNYAPFPNGFYVEIPRCQSSVVVGVQTVNSPTYCEEESQTLWFVIPTNGASYTPNPQAVQAVAHIHPNNN